MCAGGKQKVWAEDWEQQPLKPWEVSPPLSLGSKCMSLWAPCQFLNSGRNSSLLLICKVKRANTTRIANLPQSSNAFLTEQVYFKHQHSPNQMRCTHCGNCECIQAIQGKSRVHSTGRVPCLVQFQLGHVSLKEALTNCSQRKATTGCMGELNKEPLQVPRPLA